MFFLAFPWVVTSTGPGGFMICVCVFYDGNPRRLNRKQFYEDAGNRACYPWFTRYRFIPYTTARNQLITSLTELMCSQICLVIYPGMQRIMCNIYFRIFNYKLLSYMNPVHHVTNVLLGCNDKPLKKINCTMHIHVRIKRMGEAGVQTPLKNHIK